MRAAVLRTPGQPLSVEDVDLEAPRPGEVEIRILATGVCHSDLHYMHGDLQGRMPMVIGHEGTGVVERVGDGVTRFAPGDRVITMWRPRCGNCEFCATGRPALCTSGRLMAPTGGLIDGTTRLSIDGEPVHHLMGVSCAAERAVVSQTSLIGVDAEIPTEIAAITGCAVVTGVGAALNEMSEASGQGAVVIGAGGVGLSVVMGLSLIGVDPIVAVDTVDAKLDKAFELGATRTINAASQDLADELLRISPRPFSWAVDAVGLPQTLRQAFDLVGTGGTVVALGLGRVGAEVDLPVNQIVQQQKRVVGSLYGSANTPVDIPRILSLYRSGRLPLERLLGARFGLDEVNDAYASLAGSEPGRAIMVPQPAAQERVSGAPRSSDIVSAPLRASVT
ncbi:zinc-containing alcohol dehydrogenase [Mycobacteroides abscessus subsp. abscessus]|uniref:alcohol dehydrogenase catalytic domain-containing protein n=1 Tax=Brevibacterium casei TaxID=33889 RepID=UPI00092C13D1|nr:alcohol dehydrogenase catalytic domain-containing protein [Brevibacterium casei]SII60260.1 zinc-containing alcohol dehydrogenase [Mycobacteroides abscessus subsp. abscessus]